MKFASSPLGGIQEAGSSETAAESVAPFLYCRLALHARRYKLQVSLSQRVDASFMITNLHTELKPQETVSHGMTFPAFTPLINHGQLANHN